MSIRVSAALAVLLVSATAWTLPRELRSAGYFIRPSNGHTVSWIGSGERCSIYSDEQLHAWGLTEAFVSVVPPDVYQAALASRADRGKCPWPEGCYYLSGSHTFYRVTGADACRFESTTLPPECHVIKNDQQLWEVLHDRGLCPAGR